MFFVQDSFSMNSGREESRENAPLQIQLPLVDDRFYAFLLNPVMFMPFVIDFTPFPHMLMDQNLLCAHASTKSTFLCILLQSFC